MGSVLTARQIENEVTSAEISTKKYNREKLSTSDILKLSKAARDSEINKFSFFTCNKKIASKFQTVYNVIIQIEALLKTLTNFDMKGVFHITPESIIVKLSAKIETLLVYQSSEDIAKQKFRNRYNKYRCFITSFHHSIIHH